MPSTGLQRWYMAGQGSRLFRGGVGTADGPNALVARLETAEVLPAGIGGEAVFSNVYLAISRKNGLQWTLTVTPIVDGQALAANVITLDPVGTETTDIFEISLMQPYLVASVERLRFAPRGQRIRLRIEATSQTGLLFSGSPVEISAGVWRGGTHFSEFALAASQIGTGHIPGLSYAKGGGGSGEHHTEIAVKDDPVEGRYVESVHDGSFGFEPFGVWLDSFDGLFGGVVNQEIEVLSRAYVGLAHAGRSWPAIATNLRDTGGTEGLAGLAIPQFKHHAADDFGLAVESLPPNGASFQINAVDYPFGEPTDTFLWFRSYYQWKGVDNYAVRLKAWAGQVEDEPGTWALDGTSAHSSISDLGAQLGGIGFGSGRMSESSVGKVAFLSFSMDPTEPPPLPSEVLQLAPPNAEGPPNISIEGVELEYAVVREGIVEVSQT